MFGTAIAWLILMGLGLLLTQVVLKRPGVEPTQRRNALLFAAGVGAGLLLLSGLSVVSASWSDTYSDPIVSAEQLPDGDAWALVAGKVSGKSDVAEKRRKYAVYAEYTGPSRDLSTFRGDRDLVVELKDGALVEFRGFEPPAHTWSWKEERGFRYLKAGDRVLSYGYLSPRRMKKRSKVKRFSIRDVAFVYRGTPEAFQSSSLALMGQAGRWIHLVVAVLSLIGGVVIGGLTFARRQPPSEP